MSQKWVANISRHHNVETPSWYLNIEAKNKGEALLEAWRAIIENFDVETTTRVLAPILNHKELCLQLLDTEGDTVNFFMWNDGDNQGIGIGTCIKETDKYENMWISIKPRTKDNLGLAIRGYLHKLDSLPHETLEAFLHQLEEAGDLTR